MIRSVTLVREKERHVGVGTYASCLGDALKKKGVEVSYFEHWKRDLHVAGRNVGAVATPILSRLRPMPKADVTHATFSNLAGGRCQVTTVMDLIWRRETGYPESRILHTIFKRKIANGVVICPTKFVAAQVMGWLNLPHDQVFVTPLAPRLDFYVERVEERKAKVPAIHESTALIVGDANERKRTLESIKAIEGLKIKLVHAGRPLSATPYGRLCIEEAKKRAVTFEERGVVGNDEMRDLMNNSDVLLYPSTDEGFGLPPLEAAACGLTSVVGNHPVFDEVMGEQYGEALDAYHCDGRRPRSIAESVVRALHYPMKKAHLVERAKKFSWEKCATETLSAYHKAVDKEWRL